MLLSEIQIYFSYHQFAVFDENIELPGNDWTPEHFDQGFARRDSSVNWGTILQFGEAQVQVFSEAYVYDEADERVIKVPFYSPSGKVLIEGPEENSGNAVNIESGHYLLTCAQRADRENETQLIRLYFDNVAAPGVRSEIIKCDDPLQPPKQLSETAGIAAF